MGQKRKWEAGTEAHGDFLNIFPQVQWGNHKPRNPITYLRMKIRQQPGIDPTEFCFVATSHEVASSIC